MHKRFDFFVIIAAIVFLNLSACGFHLRGTTPTFPEGLAVNVGSDKNRVSPFVTQMIQQSLVQQGSDSQLDIHLHKADFSKRVLVLDENAQPVKQILMLKLDYSFVRDDNTKGDDVIRLSRSYFTNAVALASVSQYEDSVKQQMLVEAAEQIKNQLFYRLFAK